MSVGDIKRPGRDKITVAEILNDKISLLNDTEYGEYRVKKILQNVDISRRIIWRILRSQLKMYPYKIFNKRQISISNLILHY